MNTPAKKSKDDYKYYPELNPRVHTVAWLTERQRVLERAGRSLQPTERNSPSRLAELAIVTAELARRAALPPAAPKTRQAPCSAGPYTAIYHALFRAA